LNKLTLFNNNWLIHCRRATGSYRGVYYAG
jgi:hypothetical protein